MNDSGRGAVQGLMAQLIQAPGQEELGGNAWQELCSVRRLQWEKFLKAKLEDAVELFNEDYKKGFQMMQARLHRFLNMFFCRRGDCWPDVSRLSMALNI